MRHMKWAPCFGGLASYFCWGWFDDEWKEVLTFHVYVSMVLPWNLDSAYHVYVSMVLPWNLDSAK